MILTPIIIPSTAATISILIYSIIQSFRISVFVNPMALSSPNSLEFSVIFLIRVTSKTKNVKVIEIIATEKKNKFKINIAVSVDNKISSVSKKREESGGIYAFKLLSNTLRYSLVNLFYYYNLMKSLFLGIKYVIFSD